MDFIDGYREMFGTRTFISRINLTSGKIVQFTYDNEQKYALVLNPSWEGKMHALSLKNLSPDNLHSLLKELDGVVGEEEIYAKYVNSNYTEKRPYRTYRLDKISTLREIFLKPISETSKPPPEVKIEDAIVKDTPLETYTMYQDNK